MKKHRSIASVIVLLMAVTLACLGSDAVTPDPTQPPTEASPTPRPTATAEPTARLASLEVINASGVDIWYLYVAPSEDNTWGDDRLGRDILFDGDAYLISNLPDGLYDVRAEDRNGNLIGEAWELALRGDVTWTVEYAARLEIYNTTDDAIHALYIVSPDAPSWGDDWLGGEIIYPGDTYTVMGLSPGFYDVKAANVDGRTVEAVYVLDVTAPYYWTVIGKTDLPSNAVLRFKDDFSDNRNNWGRLGEGENVNYIPPTDGEYCITIKTDYLIAWEWYEPFRTDEFVAEVGCDLEETSDASCGMGFGPDGDNLFWFEVSPSEQSFALLLLQDDAWQPRLIDWTVSKNIYPDGWNYLSMERVGGVLSVYINAVLAGEVETDLFPEGRIGIGGATNEDINVTICLDDLKVWRLE